MIVGNKLRSAKTEQKTNFNTMKKLLYFAAALLLASCCAPKMKVEVSNPSETDRHHETVEIAWSELESRRFNPEEVVVWLGEEEIPSQVLFDSRQEPLALIFQASTPAGGSETYLIKKGIPAAYPSKVFGRYVPERLDDYAWENDKVAYRVYGPALETAPGQMLSTPGFDCWVKSVDTLVIDARYRRGNYHHNYGDGMDCYKVGRTLGGGASAPYVDDKLWLSGNYVSWERLNNGPIRTTVKLTYAPFRVGEQEVSLTKYISLDAYSRFNRIENIYEGDFKTLPIAAGFVRHEVKALTSTEEWLAFVEAASDSHDPASDGDLFFGVIQPGAEFRAEADGHAVALTEAESGVPMIYYAGSGWSRGGVKDMRHWMTLMEEAATAVCNPLEVSIL